MIPRCRRPLSQVLQGPASSSQLHRMRRTTPPLGPPPNQPTAGRGEPEQAATAVLGGAAPAQHLICSTPHPPLCYPQDAENLSSLPLRSSVVQRLQRFATYGHLKQLVLRIIADDMAQYPTTQKETLVSWRAGLGVGFKGCGVRGGSAEDMAQRPSTQKETL